MAVTVVSALQPIPSFPYNMYMPSWSIPHLAFPDAVWALLLIPVLIFLWWHSRRERNRVTQGWSDLSTYLPVHRGMGRLLLLLIVVLLVAAWTGPEWGTSTISPTTTAHDVLVFVDVSQSMLAEDQPPLSRLVRAQNALLELLGHLDATRSTARLGVVVFAGQTRLLCPPTEDRRHLEQVIRDLTTESLGMAGRLTDDQGSAIGTSLGSVAKWLAQWARDNGADREFTQCLIISDGDDLSARTDARLNIWASVPYRVHAYAIGDGTKDWPIPQGSSYLMTVDAATGKSERALTRRQDEVLREVTENRGGTLILEDNRPRPLVTWWDRDMALLPTRVLQNQTRQAPINRADWLLAAAGFFLLFECALGGARRREW